MALKSDKWIMRMAKEKELIAPFVSKQVRKKNISFGLSSFGYDIRLGNEFKIFKPASRDFIVDPKNITDAAFRYIKTDVCTVAANSFVLAKSLEYFKMPDNVLGIVSGKSTYARCGILVNVTPLEPGWEGFLTISISNTTPRPVKIYAHEGIAQILFLASAEKCALSYRDKKGRYQGQKEITLAKIKN